MFLVQNSDSIIWKLDGYLDYGVKTYSGDLKSDHLKSGLFESRISNGRALAMMNIKQLDNFPPLKLVQYLDPQC